MQEQFITGTGAVNICNRAVLGARVCEHHAVTTVLLKNKLLGNVALLHMVPQVMPVRLACVCIQLESLADLQAGFNLANVHQAGTAEV